MKFSLPNCIPILAFVRDRNLGFCEIKIVDDKEFFFSNSRCDPFDLDNVDLFQLIFSIILVCFSIFCQDRPLPVASDAFGNIVSSL